MRKRFILWWVLLLVVCHTASATVKPRRGRPAENDTNKEAEATETHQGMRKVGLHSTAPLTSMGSPKVPVVLVQFSDVRFTSGLGTHVDASGKEVKNRCETADDEAQVHAFYDKFCNGEGEPDGYYKGAGSYGAIREYFRDQSGGLFTPQFVVLGPVTLDQTCAYYGGNDGSRKDVNLSAFYRDAIRGAQLLYEDWNVFDNDADGTVDMAFFIFAGKGENGDGGKETIWPQERSSGGTINGVGYGCYACCNEEYRGATDGIGVFVHELSHALGLPDFYDTNYVAYGMDYWDVMDSGCYCDESYTPCNYTAYERDFMGWTPLVQLHATQPQRITLIPMAAGGVGYKIVNPENEDEYYVLENRQPSGWDTFMGRGTEERRMHGMMVTHVDYLRSAWVGNAVNTSRTHQRMVPLPADGELYSYMDVATADQQEQFLQSAAGNLFPGAANVTELSGEAAYVYTSTGETPHQMNQPLTDITENADGSITLTYMGTPSALNMLFANKKEQVAVYDLMGIQVGTTDIEHGKPTRLPVATGVYLVDGKKFVVGK